MQLTQLLEAMIERGAGDLHLQAGSQPMLRIGGHLVGLDGPAMTDDGIRELLRQMAYEDAQIRLDEHRSSDFSFEMPNTARFRVNAFYERGRLSMALRRIPIDIPAFEDLNLPYTIQEIAQSPRGLILVTGTRRVGEPVQAQREWALARGQIPELQAVGADCVLGDRCGVIGHLAESRCRAGFAPR
jgi:twitching motility protein PilT